jgi:catechol 2,3-dioxygenase-like lactoylglutathione lyase family enzyme
VGDNRFAKQDEAIIVKEGSAMTANLGFIPPTRREGALGVHSVDHFAMVVPDLAEAQRFYREFGLDVREEDGGLGLYTMGNPHRWARIVEGKRKQLHHVSFGAFEDDMPRFADHLQSLGVQRIDAPAGFESNGIWFRDPDGALREICAAEKTSANEKAAFSVPICGPSERGSVSREEAPTVRPKRFSHMLTFVGSAAKAIAFYSEVTGLKLADSAGADVAFMHAIHGSDHHILAFATGGGSGLHHSSWDMGGIENIGLGAMHMADSGYARGWGLGRHVLGSNYFHYIRDPWGSYAEYSADIDYIPHTQDWEAKSWAPHNAFYLWGPTPPEDFVINHEVA